MGLFGKKKEKDNDGLVKSIILQTQYTESGALNEAVQLMSNDGVNICAEACACCWDTKLPDKFADRVNYIAKRTKIGHDSVTEHSNHVYYIEVADEDMKDLAEFLSACQYIHTVYRHSKKFNKGYLITGGSWRAYKDIIMKLPSIHENSIIRKLMHIIYNTMPSASMQYMIDQEYIQDDFDDKSCEANAIFANNNYSKCRHFDVNEKIEIVNADDFNVLLSNVADICPEPELFTKYDLLDMCTVTVLFKGMSRIITQQLTRHRNAITQESQRYVNYGNGAFNSPALFKDKYDPNYQYPIQFGKSSQKMTLQEIGDAIAKIYPQLTDKDRTDGHDLQFEDARAYLPNNIQCNKIYMTFTWRSLFKFLELREDNHAQVEIRQFAVVIGNWFRSLYPEYDNFKESLDGYLYLNSFTNKIHKDLYTDDAIDEVLSEEDIIAEMEEYAATTEPDSDDGDDE